MISTHDIQVSIVDRLDDARDPWPIFYNWKSEETDPEVADAMALSTATLSCSPLIRMVMQRGESEGRLLFYSCDHSNKGKALKDNPQASFLMLRKEPLRQVIISGFVKIMNSELADAYFASRSKTKKIISRLSIQSSEIKEGYSSFQERIMKEKKIFENTDYIPRPDFWVCYGLLPIRFEFWIGDKDRLHRRFLFSRKDEKKHKWTKIELYP